MRLPFLAALLVVVAAGAPLPAPARATDRPVRIRAVGDVAIVGTLRDEVIGHGFDPFAALAGAMADADLSFGNLEAVLTQRPPLDGVMAEEGVPLLRSPARSAQLLRESGFDVVSLANNHAFDFGPAGLLDSLSAVRSAGLLPVGAGATAEEARSATIVERHGMRIGLLAFAEKTNQHIAGEAYVARLANAVERVRALRPQVDVVLVSIHWGVQYAARPEPWQRRMAHALIDAGADAILGHHPHVLQTVEVHAGKPILYSLGNFVFGPQPAPRDASVIAEFEVLPHEVVSLRMIPVMLRGFAGSPVVSTGAQGERARDRLRPSLAWLERDGVLELPFVRTVATR